uniref:6-cysteine protein n=1 Tax=Strongyloides venezuelensis TaxID=75913 RepID=A0A0K0G4C7_STRVS
MSITFRRFVIILYSIVFLNVALCREARHDRYKCSYRYGLYNDAYVEFGKYDYKEDTMNYANHFGGMTLHKNDHNQYPILGSYLEEKLGFITVTAVYVNGDELKKGFQGKQKLWIMICNLNHKYIFYPQGDPYKEGFNAYYDRPTRCSLWTCELGLYFMDNYMEADHVLEKSDTRQAYYIGINTVNQNDHLIFKTFEYEGEHFPLIPCPIAGWIHPTNIMKFEPNEYVINNGIPISNDNGRHALVLAIPSNGYKDIVYCGDINQIIFEDVHVGLQIRQKKDHTDYKEIRFEEGMKIKCDGNFADLKHVHIYTPPDTSYFGNQMTGLRINPKSYYVHSGERIITFNEDKYLKTFDSYHINYQLEDDYYDKRESIQPECIGKVEDIDATLKFTINNDVIDYESYPTGGNYIKIDVSKRNQKIQVGCEAVSDNTDPRFKEFYKFRYEYRLMRITNTTKGVTESEEVKHINTNLSPVNIFGVYSCEMKPPHSNTKIKSYKFILLPKINRIIEKNVKVSSNSFHFMSCPKFYMGIGKIVDINVKLNNGREFKLSDSPRSMEETRDYYIVKLTDKNHIDKTIISCHYNAFEKEFVTVRKVLYYSMHDDEYNMQLP